MAADRESSGEAASWPVMVDPRGCCGAQRLQLRAALLDSARAITVLDSRDQRKLPETSPARRHGVAGHFLFGLH
jgi:hypothetical protein